MKRVKIGLRILILIAGILLIGNGVALTIRSDLGTSPISSIPYVLNLILPNITVGTFAIIINLIMVLIQVIILKKKSSINQLVQIPLLFLLGFSIDLNLYLTQSLDPNNYILQIITVILGCFIMAFGIFLELKADVGYLPGEGLTLVISEAYDINFGKTKVAIDTSFVVISVILAFTFYGKLEGIREGTIFAALFVGTIANIYQKRILFLDKILKPEKAIEYVTQPYMITDNFVITISRQYGSGGHAVGEIIAKKLGVGFYDSKIIDLTSIASGFTPEYVEKHEQKLPNGLLDKLYNSNYSYINEVIPPNDKLFIAQTAVIRNIAANESCVIVGRAANYILKGHKKCFNAFVHADKDFRKKRVEQIYMIDPNESLRLMDRKDKERDEYSCHYTGKHWDNLKEYDLTVDTSLFGIEATADMIIEAAEKAGILKSDNY